MYKILLILFLSFFSFEVFAKQKTCVLKMVDANSFISKSELKQKYKCEQGDRIFVHYTYILPGFIYLNNFAFHNCDYSKQIIINANEDGGTLSCVIKSLESR